MTHIDLLEMGAAVSLAVCMHACRFTPCPFDIVDGDNQPATTNGTYIVEKLE